MKVANSAQNATVSLGAGSVTNQSGNVVPTMAVSLSTGASGDQNSFSERSNSQQNDAKLVGDVMITQGWNPAIIQVTGIPYAKYNVYFYFLYRAVAGNGNTRGGFVGITNSQSSTFVMRYEKQLDNNYAVLPAVTSSGSNWLLSTTSSIAANDDWASIQPGNYLVFNGLTNGDFTALIGALGIVQENSKDPLGNRITNATPAYFNWCGVQIEEVPALAVTNLVVAGSGPFYAGDPSPHLLTVMAQYSDGSQGNVTSLGATFSSANTSIFTVSTNGVIQAQNAGVTNLVVSYKVLFGDPGGDGVGAGGSPAQH